MHFTTGLLLSVTFLASVSLLALMQQRRLIRRLPLFFVLLLFYLLRSAILIVGMKLFDRAAYLQVAFFTSLLDLALQLAIAYSLARNLTQLRRTDLGRATSRLWNSAPFLFAVDLLLAGGLTLALVSVLPVSPVPLDRGVIFSGLVFLPLFFLRNRDARSPEARLLTGFCVVSAANILSQWGRTIAAAHHDPRLFLAWAYGNTAVWVCVLLFWILRLQPTPKPLRANQFAPPHAKPEPNPL
jgi:hypothetical protein